jgi:hypothetical protein
MNRPGHFRDPQPSWPLTASLYRSQASDPLSTLGNFYHPPEVFEHGRETLVAEITASNEDARAVRIFEVRLPTAFYAVESDGFRVATGSGNDIGRLVSRIALAISCGELRISALVVPEA